MVDKVSIETFRDIGSYELRNLQQGEPSCFNGIVRAEKFIVTVEKVVEPVEVVRARIQKMWDECDNHHHREPLIRAGLKYGLDLRKRAQHELDGKPSM